MNKTPNIVFEQFEQFLAKQNNKPQVLQQQIVQQDPIIQQDESKLIDYIAISNQNQELQMQILQKVDYLERKMRKQRAEKKQKNIIKMPKKKIFEEDSDENQPVYKKSASTKIQQTFDFKPQKTQRFFQPEQINMDVFKTLKR